MREIRDLGLTLKQAEEVNKTDPLLVAAWLERVDDDLITNPTAWFLTGIRSGIFPHQLADNHRAQAIQRAERWITNAGLFCTTEADILDELFDGPSAMLRQYADEEPLRDKMVTLWRLERPRGYAAEQEAEARAARQRAGRQCPQKADA